MNRSYATFAAAAFLPSAIMAQAVATSGAFWAARLRDTLSSVKPDAKYRQSDDWSIYDEGKTSEGEVYPISIETLSEEEETQTVSAEDQGLSTDQPIDTVQPVPNGVADEAKSMADTTRPGETGKTGRDQI